jgi:hypothetical protein
VVRADQLFRPHVETLGDVTNGGNRTVVGDGWGELLAIPLSDLPGRISGYLFIGRDGRMEDIVFRPLYTGLHFLKKRP